jgi:hypothetical protein
MEFRIRKFAYYLFYAEDETKDENRNDDQGHNEFHRVRART